MKPAGENSNVKVISLFCDISIFTQFSVICFSSLIGFWNSAGADS